MDKEFAEAFKEEIEKEASTYTDKARDDEKKKKKHFAFGGKKKSRHGESGYGKGEEMDREFAEAFGLDERKMTDGEKEEREEIVKKLKPKLQSFKDKYGDDAKKVMYATATKQAMEEFKIDEGWMKGKYKVTDGKRGGKVLGTFNSGSKAQKFVDDLFQKGDYEALTVELIDEAKSDYEKEIAAFKKKGGKVKKLKPGKKFKSLFKQKGPKKPPRKEEVEATRMPMEAPFVLDKEEVDEKIDMKKAGYGGSRHKDIERDKYNKKRKGKGLEVVLIVCVLAILTTEGISFSARSAKELGTIFA